MVWKGWRRWNERELGLCFREDAGLGVGHVDVADGFLLGSFVVKLRNDAEPASVVNTRPPSLEDQISVNGHQYVHLVQ